MNLSLDASALIGTVSGYLLFISMFHRGHSKTIFRAAFWLMLVAWTVIELTPFSPTSGGALNIIPFATMLQGSMEKWCTWIGAVIVHLFRPAMACA